MSPDDNEPGYDEQEMSMDVRNDDVDQYHRNNTSGGSSSNGSNADKYLRAAIAAQNEPIAMKEQNVGSQNIGDGGHIGNHLSHPGASDNREAESEKMHLKSNGKAAPPPPPQIPNGVNKMGGSVKKNGFASIGRHSKLSSTSADASRYNDHASDKSHRNISNPPRPSIIGGSLYENKGFDMQAV